MSAVSAVSTASVRVAMGLGIAVASSATVASSGTGRGYYIVGGLATAAASSSSSAAQEGQEGGIAGTDGGQEADEDLERRVIRLASRLVRIRCSSSLTFIFVLSSLRLLESKEKVESKTTPVRRAVPG